MQDNLIAAIQYRDPNTKEIKILPAIPGKSAYNRPFREDLQETKRILIKY